MLRKKLLTLTLVIIMAVPIIAVAGHHYGGYGCMGKIQGMTDLDTDGNGRLTLDEFTAPAMEKWQSGFDMIDTDKNGEINADEYDEFLRVHGMGKK